MTKDLENLVRQAESDIDNRVEKIKTTSDIGAKRKTLSHISFPLGLWIFVLVLGAFQFDTVISLVMTPTEDRIEEDLGHVLQNAAATVNRYEADYGELPFLLPNPAIRGLVQYERRSDFSYRLSATVHTVTMVLESSETRPYRENER